MWLVFDGDTLYVDRNGNGDLTDPGEKIAVKPLPRPREDTDTLTFEVGDITVGGRTHKTMNVFVRALSVHTRGWKSASCRT